MTKWKSGFHMVGADGGASVRIFAPNLFLRHLPLLSPADSPDFLSEWFLKSEIAQMRMWYVLDR
ncbi:hypothetical protein B9J78_04000 [bacterium Unc6]|nr:hypothetical protein [bacterium Unc6]